MLALEYRRSPARFLTVRGASSTRFGARMSGALATNVAPLRLVNHAEPARPATGWTRLKPLLSGICGSDLSLLTGRSSPYLGALVSMPFVPGHEVVAETLDDLPGLARGTRVVVDPVLSCVARAVPPCRWCQVGRHSRCDRITGGRLAAGLQTGFCTDTGGGWSRRMLAHASQLHPVPDGLDDHRAVLTEPLACAIHSVRRVAIPDGAAALVVGAGTVGLLTVLALRAATRVGPIYVIAKHGHQRERARALGATEVFEPSRAARALRRACGGTLEHPVLGPEFLLGGADLAYECSGAASGLDTALRLVRAGGTVVLSGMPSGRVDLTPVWFRELRLVGSYASDGRGVPEGADGASTADAAGAADGSGVAEPGDEPADRAGQFAEALTLAAAAPLDGYVNAVYSLSRWREAIGHAARAGELGTIKVAFDPRRN
ncbi:zinc-binding dehydrogenase [Micromonospora sp. NPDC007271]|uniref:zinc-dependent alcohol dehydrogenase n=1 Tax=Micromonospora sp. NPDC007271 TaxID=3154587 RepID=UPI00340555C4